MKLAKDKPTELYTTFALLKEKRACKKRYKYLGTMLGGTSTYGRYTPIPLVTILEINGKEDLFWVLKYRAAPKNQWKDIERMCRLCATDIAKRGFHYMQDSNIKEGLQNDLETIRKLALTHATTKEFATIADKLKRQRPELLESALYWIATMLMYACSNNAGEGLEAAHTFLQYAIDAAYFPTNKARYSAEKRERAWKIQRLKKYLQNPNLGTRSKKAPSNQKETKHATA